MFGMICASSIRFDPTMTSLATTIRIARGRQRLSQEQLSEKSGVAVRTISNIEKGVTAAPQPDTLVQLSEALGLDPETLLAPASVAAQADSDQGSVDPETQQSPASKDATAPRGAQVSTTAPTVEAGEAKTAA